MFHNAKTHRNARGTSRPHIHKAGVGIKPPSRISSLPDEKRVPQKIRYIRSLKKGIFSETTLQNKAPLTPEIETYLYTAISEELLEFTFNGLTWIVVRVAHMGLTTR